MTLHRTQFAYLSEDSDEPIVVTIKPVDRTALYRQIEAKELSAEISIGEFNRRLIHVAAIRAGLVDAKTTYEDWFATLDALEEVEAEESGEAGATPAS